MALMLGIAQRGMMKNIIFVFGLVCVAFGPATNAFRQSFRQRCLAIKVRSFKPEDSPQQHRIMWRYGIPVLSLMAEG